MVQTAKYKTDWSEDRPLDVMRTRPRNEDDQRDVYTGDYGNRGPEPNQRV